MDENHFTKNLSSPKEEEDHGSCEEPEVCQLTHEASMGHLRRLWRALMRRPEKTEFEEVTLCGANVSRFLSEQLGSGCQWVRYAALDLLCVAVPRLGGALLLPLLPRALRHAHATPLLRLKAVHFARALRKHPDTDLHSLCSCFVTHGLRSPHAGLRLACIHGTSVIFDEDLEDPQYALLLPALSRPLTRPPGPAYLPAFRALRRLHARMGDVRFHAHVTSPHYDDLLLFEETDPYLATPFHAPLPRLLDAYQRKRRRVRLALAFGVADPALLGAMKKGVESAPKALEAAVRGAGATALEAHAADLLHLAGALLSSGEGGAQEAGLGVVWELAGRLGLALAPHLERAAGALLASRLPEAERVVARLMREVHPMTVLLELLRAGPAEPSAVKVLASRVRTLPFHYVDFMTLCRCMGQYASSGGSAVQRASKECLDLLMDMIDNSPVPDLKAQVLNTLIRDKILQPRPLWSSGGSGDGRAPHTADDRDRAATVAARHLYGSGVEEEESSSSHAPPSSDVMSERKGEGDAQMPPTPWKDERVEVGAGDSSDDEQPSPWSSEATTREQQPHIMCQVKQMNPKKYNFNILRISTPPDTPRSVFEVEEEEGLVHPSCVMEPDTPDSRQQRAASFASSRKTPCASGRAEIDDRLDELIRDEQPTFDEEFPFSAGSEEAWPVVAEQVVRMTNFSDHSCYEYLSESDKTPLEKPPDPPAKKKAQNGKAVEVKKPSDKCDRRETEEDSGDPAEKCTAELFSLADGPKERGDFGFEAPSEERVVARDGRGEEEEEEEIEVPPASYPIDDIADDSPPFKKGRELPRTPVKVSEKSDLLPEKPKKLAVARKKPQVKREAKKKVLPEPEVEEEEIEEEIEEEERGAGESAYKGSQWRRDLEYASKGGECAWAERFEGSIRRMRPFDSDEAAETALKKALDDLEGDQWKSKEEAMSAVLRAAKHHARLVSGQEARLVVAVCGEVKNFRQSVAGKAILTAANLYAMLGKQLESKLRLVVGALLSKSGNRTLAAYFRLVIRSLFQIIRHSSLPKVALAFVKEGSRHANKASRETAAQFVSVLTERLGWKGALSAPMAPHMLRCAHDFAADCSPLTRYCGKRMLRVLLECPHLDRLREQHLDVAAAASLLKVQQQVRARGVADELLPIHLIK